MGNTGNLDKVIKLGAFESDRFWKKSWFWKLPIMCSKQSYFLWCTVFAIIALQKCSVGQLQRKNMFSLGTLSGRNRYLPTLWFMPVVLPSVRFAMRVFTCIFGRHRADSKIFNRQFWAFAHHLGRKFCLFWLITIVKDPPHPKNWHGVVN